MRARYLMVPITALVGVAALASCGGEPALKPCKVAVIVGTTVVAQDSTLAAGACVSVVRLEAADSAGGDGTPTYTVLSVQAADSAGGDSTPGQ